MRNAQLIAAVLLLVSFLVACAPTAPPAPAASAPPPAAVPASALATAAPAVAPTRPAWEAKWDTWLQGAKSEGTVVIYTSSGSLRPGVPRAFYEAHRISAEVVSSPAASLNEKLLREHRAGLYLVDVAMLGAKSSLNFFKPAGILTSMDGILILPEVVNPKMWSGGEMPWADADHTTFAPSFYVSGGQIVLNKNLAKPDEFKSWRDLLNPKWKKQIVMTDVTLGTGPQTTWARTMGAYIMGWDYLRDLVKQEPLVLADVRMMIEWVARGKYPIGLGGRGEMINEFWKLGLIDSVVPNEGTYTTEGAAAPSTFKNVPHPNAAKVYLNWYLSKEGQTAFVQAAGYPSGRVDVATTGVCPALIPDPKLKYVPSYREDIILELPKHDKIVEEIFGPLKR